jgi:nucleoside-diphosphate-sugar epimerase
LLTPIIEDTDWDLSVDRNQNWDAGHPDITRFRIYTASKLLANQASWDYVNTEKPHFALVTLHPAFVYGHNLVQSSAAEIQGSTNGLLFGSVMNGPSSDSTLSSVYVGDVAEAQIRSLRPEIKSGSKYFLSGPRVTWKEVAEVLQKYYPNVPTKVVSTEKSTVPLTDTSKAERELGIQFAKPEVFIREVMDQQLAFLSKK